MWCLDIKPHCTANVSVYRISNNKNVFWFKSAQYTDVSRKERTDFDSTEAFNEGLYIAACINVL